MDKIGEANIPIEVRVKEMIDDEKRKSEEAKKKAEEENAKAEEEPPASEEDFIFGTNFVFSLADPVFPGDPVPMFSCNCLVQGERIEVLRSSDLKDQAFVLLFYPKDFTTEGETTMNLASDLMADSEFDLAVIACSTD